MDRLGSKTQLISLQFAIFEEMVEKQSPVRFCVSKTGDVAGDLSLVLDVDLYKLAFLEERISAGVVFGGFGWGGRSLRPSLSKKIEAQQDRGQKQQQLHARIRA